MPQKEKTVFYAGRGVFIKMIQQSLLILVISGVVGFGVNHFRSDGLALVEDWSPESQAALDTGENIHISLEKAESLYQTGTVLFIDARSPQEYAAGHIQDAMNIPWDMFDDYIGDALEKLPDDKTLITYCDGEACHLSKDLAVALTDLGYSDVKILINGWTVWREAGLPVEKTTDMGS